MCQSIGMKAWIVRFASLYIFNTVMVFVIGIVTPKVSVGWSALWGGVILTIATIWVKPFIGSFFRKWAAKHASKQKVLSRKLIEYLIVFAVALVVWILVVMLSGITVSNILVGYVVPSLLLLVGWALYDLAIDDTLERVAARAYDRVTGARTEAETPAAPTAAERAARDIGRAELNDGLTPEQRRMMDEL